MNSFTQFAACANGLGVVINPPNTHFSRQEWITRSHFHPLEQGAVLAKVLEEATQAGRNGEAGVLLDLDSTLYEVAPRTIEIFRDWHGTASGGLSPSLNKILGTLSDSHTGYSLKDLFEALGLNPNDREADFALKSARAYWWERFFREDYLHHDRPNSGAVEFVKQLHNTGARVIYLTGRSAPEMREGTVRNLMRDGFPLEKDGAILLMKPRAELDDKHHKESAVSNLMGQSNLIASFENEPVNLMAMNAIAPEAIHVFVDTVCSEAKALPGKALYRIRDFIQV